MGWMYTDVTDVISDDFQISDSVIFVKVGGTASITSGEVILIFDKQNISSLNRITDIRLDFNNNIVTNQQNIWNDSVDVTFTPGFYHDIHGFYKEIQTQGSGLNSNGVKWTEGSTTGGEYYASVPNGGFSIETYHKFAIKIKIEASNILRQAGFNIIFDKKPYGATESTSYLNLMLYVSDTKYYNYFDLDGGTSTFGEDVGGGVRRAIYSDGWVMPEKEGYKFLGWTDGVNNYNGLPMHPADSAFTTDIHLKALWEKIYKELIIMSSEGGSGYSRNLISGSYYDEGKLWFNPGAIVDVKAYAKPKYKFVKWEDDSTANPRRIVMNNDYTIQAFYEKTGSSVYLSGYEIGGEKYTVLCDIYVGDKPADIYVGSKLI